MKRTQARWYLVAMLVLGLGIAGAILLPYSTTMPCDCPPPAVCHCPIDRHIELRIFVAFVGAMVAAGVLLLGRSNALRGD